MVSVPASLMSAWEYHRVPWWDFAFFSLPSILTCLRISQHLLVCLLMTVDTAIYTVVSTQDQNQLQQDLHRRMGEELGHALLRRKVYHYHLASDKEQESLSQWLQIYKLHVNTPNCSVNSAKYLGVTLHKDLSWNEHIDNICSTAKTLFFPRRNKRINETAYKSFVRPILEYACTVWDPQTQDTR